ncbi:MAG TPA: N-acetylmuramoyl-L-alanine amidase [Clostridia bacterium]|nr:N-acetylmuramoyl-L-alanine amidase [Clostridia bacterium]
MIVIDPGHGGSDPGATGPSGLKEKDVTLAVSLRLADKLKQLGAQVQLTRRTDQGLPLAERVYLINSFKSQVFASIHCNAHSNPQAGGVEIWHSYRGDYGSIYYREAMRIASIVQEQLVQGTGLKNRGIKYRLVDTQGSPIYGLDYFYLHRKAKCPGLIIELGFISNPAEEALLADPAFQDKAAAAITAGLAAALGLTGKPPCQPGPPALKETTVIFKGTRLQGFILDGRAYVEVRKLAETMGAAVHWDPNLNQVVIQK